VPAPRTSAEVSVGANHISPRKSYYRARYYDPGAGRFLNEDPIGFNGGDTDLYRYTRNDPVILQDPFGRQSGVVAGGGVAVETTITVVSTEGTSTYAPVLILVAEGSGEGATAGPIGVLIGTIGALGTYDTYEFYHLGQAYGWWGPSSSGADSSTGERKCDTDDDCDLQLKNDESVCRVLPDPRARARCWRSPRERWLNCKRGVYVPPLVTDPDE
jgi:RHS repeat-associated protein